MGEGDKAAHAGPDIVVADQISIGTQLVIVAVVLAVGGAVIALYFLPSILANRRHDPKYESILLFNFLLGWTVVGWVIALVWALKRSSVWTQPSPDPVTSAWHTDPVKDWDGPEPEDDRPTERLAIWSLLCSIIGFVTGLAAVAGIVLGFKARARIIRAEGATKGEGLALAGIITGFGALIFLVAIALVIALVPHSTGQSADAALAQRQLIPASGYPSRFVGQGPGTEWTQTSYFSGWGGQLAQLVKCLGMTYSHIDANPVVAAGQEYDRGSVWINDTVSVFPTTADANADAEAAANTKALSCAIRLAGQGWGPGLGPSEHDRLPIALGVLTFGRHDSNELYSVNYTYRGKVYTYYVDWVTLQKGRSESNLIISDLRSPVHSDLVNQLVKAAEGRMTSRLNRVSKSMLRTS